MDEPNEVVDQLLARCRADHAAWINGDASPYGLPDDGTIMGAFGGVGHGGVQAADRQRAVASLWEAGTGDVELVAGGIAGGVAWLVMTERASVRFVGRRDSVRWDLRVTELFRRSGGDWIRFHRHADPLVDVHALDEVLALVSSTRQDPATPPGASDAAGA